MYKCKNSSDMIEDRLKILNEVKKGTLTPKQADEKLLFLHSVSVSVDLENDIYNKCAEEVEEIWGVNNLAGQTAEEFGRSVFKRFFEKHIRLFHSHR